MSVTPSAGIRTDQPLKQSAPRSACSRRPSHTNRDGSGPFRFQRACASEPSKSSSPSRSNLSTTTVPSARTAASISFSRSGWAVSSRTACSLPCHLFSPKLTQRTAIPARQRKVTAVGAAEEKHDDLSPNARGDAAPEPRAAGRDDPTRLARLQHAAGVADALVECEVKLSLQRHAVPRERRERGQS